LRKSGLCYIFFYRYKTEKYVALLTLLALGMVRDSVTMSMGVEDAEMNIYAFSEGWLSSGKGERLFSKSRSLSEKRRSLFYAR
jgi:hypothetical protein